MKKAITLAFLFFSCTTISFAQSTDKCHTGWSQWQVVYEFAPNVEFRVAFNYLIKSKAGSFNCQESFYKFSNDYLQKGAYIKFKFNYRATDGSIKTADISVELNRTGVLFNSTSDWYMGYDIIGGIYDIKFDNPQKNKAKELAASVNTAITNFDAAYNQANAQLAKVQDPQKRQNLQTKLNNTRTTFLQYKEQAQTQLNNGEGDAMATTLSNIKDQQEQLKMIDLDIEMASHPIKLPPDDGRPKIKSKAATLGGERGEVTTPKPESVALTNAQAQKQQYQNNADNYLAAANNSTEDINKAMNLNLAKINATASGNATQVAQVQQMQNQQQTEIISKIASQTVDLFTSISDAKTKREEAQKALKEKIIKEQKLIEEEDEMEKRKEKIAITEGNKLQYEIDLALLRNYMHTNISTVSDTINQIYFITYDRDYNLNNVQIKTYTLNKYNDGTYMLRSDILKKIGFTEYYYFNKNGLGQLLGYFINKQEAIDLIQKIKMKFTTKVDYTFISLNKPTTNTVDNNFWNQ